MITVDTGRGSLRCVTTRPVMEGASVLAGVRPEHVNLSHERPVGQANVFDATVISARFEGGRVKYRVALGDMTAVAYGPPGFAPDERLHVTIDPAQVILLPDLPVGAGRAG
jgi:ABC-type Fe3+/spermidine/putrescine transport system ATPase subunit